MSTRADLVDLFARALEGASAREGKTAPTREEIAEVMGAPRVPDPRPVRVRAWSGTASARSGWACEHAATLHLRSRGWAAFGLGAEVNREAFARAAVISTLTAGALVALAVRPELAEPIGGALVVLVPAVIDSWAFVVRHREGSR